MFTDCFRIQWIQFGILADFSTKLLIINLFELVCFRCLCPVCLALHWRVSSLKTTGKFLEVLSLFDQQYRPDIIGPAIPVRFAGALLAIIYDRLFGCR